MKIATITKTTLWGALIVAGLACSARAADVNENWTKNCLKCHGKDGKGNTKPGRMLNIKDLTDAKFQGSFTDEDALKSLKTGINDKDGKVRMKAAEGMSDDELKALIAYVRTLKS